VAGTIKGARNIEGGIGSTRSLLIALSNRTRCGYAPAPTSLEHRISRQGVALGVLEFSERAWAKKRPSPWGDFEKLGRICVIYRFCWSGGPVRCRCCSRNAVFAKSDFEGVKDHRRSKQY
jgi:hypothetical protein